MWKYVSLKILLAPHKYRKPANLSTHSWLFTVYHNSTAKIRKQFRRISCTTSSKLLLNLTCYFVGLLFFFICCALIKSSMLNRVLSNRVTQHVSTATLVFYPIDHFWGARRGDREKHYTRKKINTADKRESRWVRSWRFSFSFFPVCMARIKAVSNYCWTKFEIFDRAGNLDKRVDSVWWIGGKNVLVPNCKLNNSTVEKLDVLIDFVFLFRFR